MLFRSGETQKGYWWKTECGGRQVEDKSVLPVGVVNFAIKKIGIFALRLRIVRNSSVPESFVPSSNVQAVQLTRMQ